MPRASPEHLSTCQNGAANRVARSPPPAPSPVSAAGFPFPGNRHKLCGVPVYGQLSEGDAVLKVFQLLFEKLNLLFEVLLFNQQGGLDLHEASVALELLLCQVFGEDPGDHSLPAIQILLQVFCIFPLSRQELVPFVQRLLIERKNKAAHYENSPFLADSRSSFGSQSRFSLITSSCGLCVPREFFLD